MQFVDEVQFKIVSISKFETEQSLTTVMNMGMLEGVSRIWDRF